MVNEQRRHITAAFLLAVAIFVALLIIDEMGLGGIDIHPPLLALGLASAEVGRSLTCFGVRYKRVYLECLGVFLQSLAWFAWSLNLSFVEHEGLAEIAMALSLLSALMMMTHFCAKSFVSCADPSNRLI